MERDGRTSADGAITIWSLWLLGGRIRLLLERTLGLVIGHWAGVFLTERIGLLLGTKLILVIDFINWLWSVASGDTRDGSSGVERDGRDVGGNYGGEVPRVGPDWRAGAHW